MNYKKLVNLKQKITLSKLGGERDHNLWNPQRISIQ